MTTSNKKSKAVRTLEALLGEELTFGNMIRSERMAMELSQDAFGKLLGIKRAYVCDLEKGRTVASVDQAIRFADLLGLSRMLFIQLAMEAQIRKHGLDYRVQLVQKKAS